MPNKIQRTPYYKPNPKIKFHTNSTGFSFMVRYESQVFGNMTEEDKENLEKSLTKNFQKFLKKKEYIE